MNFPRLLGQLVLVVLFPLVLLFVPIYANASGSLQWYISSVVFPVVNLLILTLTGLVIYVYTNETSKLVKETQKQVDIAREHMMLSKTPVIQFILSSGTTYQDLYHDNYPVKVEICNLSAFEVRLYVQVCVYVDDVYVPFMNQAEKQAYSGKKEWILQPSAIFKGHFGFGCWFLDKGQSFDEFYAKYIQSDRKSQEIQSLKKKYDSKSIRIKSSIKSRSIYGNEYNSSDYYYNVDFSKEQWLVPDYQYVSES